MKLAIRFVFPLLLLLILISWGMSPLIDTLMLRWTKRDLDIRAQLIGFTVQESLSTILESRGKPEFAEKTLNLLKKVTQDERLMAAGLCQANGSLKIKTELFPAQITCETVSHLEPHLGVVKDLPSGKVHISIVPIVNADENAKIVLVHDMSFASRRSDDTRTYLFYLFVGTGALASLLTVLIARWSQRGWVRSVRQIVKGADALLSDNSLAKDQTFQPIVKDLRNLIKELEATRTARDDSQYSWTPKTLKAILGRELRGEEVIVVSNREPYIHVRKEGKIEVQVPASGLVTAVEPILRACSGVWVAHGSGSADRDVVDKQDRVKVPPDNPQYEIQRIWLSKEEEYGYYYGFSNEGIWPLCHIAHTRPIFRKEDWEQYVAVNQKFAAAVVSTSKSDDPVILVHDYHFALVPRMIRQKLPNATIITFWHIPWPNAETFGICPWREELLQGLLGSSILGFHTQFHCNNFFDSVDRYLECRIDRENHSVTHSGSLTAIKSYPISIEFPPSWIASVTDVSQCKKHIRESLNLREDSKIGIGVDRLDYTKGIIERFCAVEKLLSTHPEWIGKFSFIQIAAPTRTSIASYQNFENEVRSLASKINSKFGNENYKPIILKVEHHDPIQVCKYFRAADLCFVSSLHDGMNLVAKEFVSAREDERGVLILSMFTGASRELVDSLIVNPYNFEQCAEALHEGLTMSEGEQKERMRSMRSYIREFNVYRWAGRMLLDAAAVRAHNRLNRRRTPDKQTSQPRILQLPVLHIGKDKV